MKITKTLLCALAATCLSIPAFAERSQLQQNLLETGTFTTLTLSGATLGGPFGMVIGAAIGALMAEETRSANNNEIALLQLQQHAQINEENLMQREHEINNLQQELTDKMTFQVLFATGIDTLNELDQQRLQKLAQFLIDNPALDIDLTGHADIRGTDEYNNVLSRERALSVKAALVAKGVAESRIRSTGAGTEFATAQIGDESGYAKDRRVSIELQPATAGDKSIAGN